MPAPNRRDIKRCFCLTSDVCLSRTSGVTWEQRGLWRPKLAQRWPTLHVTRIPLSRSKGQRSRSLGRFTHRGLNASGSCSGQRGNVLDVGNYCYLAVCLSALGASAPTRGGDRRGHIVSPRAQLVIWYICSNPIVLFCQTINVASIACQGFGT